MEDGLKEENLEKSKSPTSGDKVGWIRKSSGGLFSLWKERYIRLCKTQLVVYEDEEEQKCVENFELENYERCQDLRALLKRKNRFILIHSPGCKVQDIKFQASTPEEKELWVKAFNDSINRAKNKIFDEVKIDESLSLDHVTRGRAKLAQGRRPPTRSHLKEVASAMSDGILRLDLDVPDSGPPNSLLVASETAETPLPTETLKPPMPPAKVPMPPTERLSANPTLEDPQVKKPPIPPAKPLKEVAAPSENMNSVEVSDSEDDNCDASEDAKGTSGEEEFVQTNPPVRPPKILSDKMKVTWDSPGSEHRDVETENQLAAGSEENPPELNKETIKPPTPPPKVFKVALRSKENHTEVDPSEGDWQPDEDSNLAVNGIDGNRTIEPALQGEKEPDECSSGRGTKQKGSGLSSEDQADILEPKGGSPATKPRSSSLGQLLSESPPKPLLRPDFQQASALHVVQMEKKIAYEKEQTEKLLQKVRHEGFEEAQEGNGPPVDAEELLTEATEQLRQATQVLQEVKDLGGELRREPSNFRKGLPKDLMSVYRRSTP